MAEFTVFIDLDEQVAQITRDTVQDVLADSDYVTDRDVEQKIDDREFASEERVLELVRDLMHSEGDDFVQGVIDNNNFVQEYDVDDKVREAIDNLGDIATDNDLQRLDGEVSTRIDRVAHSLEQRIEQVELRTEGTVGAELDERVASLEARVSDYIDTLANRIEVLEVRTSGGGELGQALTFFGLLRQAFNALRI